MNNTIFERIQLIINEYNLNETTFSEKVGIKQSTFSKGKTRNSDLKYMTIVNILTAFPEISVEWLVLGEGEMMKASSGSGELVKSLRSQIAHLEGEVAYLREQNMLLLKEGGDASKKAAV